MNRLYVVGLLSVLATACGGAHASSETADVQERSEPASSSRAKVGDDETQVMQAQESEPATPEVSENDAKTELIEAGAEPLTELRYEFEEGRTHEMIMDMQMTMSISIEGNQGAAVTMPKMRTRIELEEEKVLENGNVHARSVIRDMTIADDKNADPAAVTALKEELDGLEGLEGWVEMTAAGAVVAGEYKTPAGASPQLKQMVQQMQNNIKQLSFPLPLEPVGVGAKWRVMQVVRNNGLSFDQVSTCTLKSHRGKQLKLKCALEQDAEGQPFTEGLPPNTTGRLLSHEAAGSSEITLNLSSLVPKSSSKVEATTRIELSTDGQKLEMETKMTMKMDVRRD